MEADEVYTAVPLVAPDSDVVKQLTEGVCLVISQHSNNSSSFYRGDYKQLFDLVQVIYI